MFDSFVFLPLPTRAYFKGRAYIKIILKNHARSYFAGRSYYRGNTVFPKRYYRSFVIFGAYNAICRFFLNNEHSINNEEHVMTPQVCYYYFIGLIEVSERQTGYLISSAPIALVSTRCMCAIFANLFSILILY